MSIIIEIWDAVLLGPMINGLIFLYGILAQDFGLAIIAFTVAVRVAMYPLTRKQLNASRAMSQLQPKIQEIRKQYGKDSARVTQETMKLYKEHGANPIGCLGPMVVQLPIWIGLYQSIIQAMAKNPERLVDLSQKLYAGVPGVHTAIPLNKYFLGFLDLSEPDPTKVMLPLIVGGSMWVQQKMMANVSTDPKQAQMNQMMQWMMPIMFGFITIGFPSGLALYWVVSNVIGIVLQYRASGWGNLFPEATKTVQTGKSRSNTTDNSKEKVDNGESGSVGQDSGGGDRPSTEATGSRPRRGRRRRRNRR